MCVQEPIFIFKTTYGLQPLNINQRTPINTLYVISCREKVKNQIAQMCTLHYSVQYTLFKRDFNFTFQYFTYTVYVHMCICTYQTEMCDFGVAWYFQSVYLQGALQHFFLFCVCERRELRGPLKQLVTFLLHFSKKIKILFSVFIISHTILALAINNMEKCCDAPYTPHYR